MSSNFYFFWQKEGKESAWQLAIATDRQKIRAQGPAFMTILDLSSVPDDNDWTKVRYQGPFYADFDAEEDLELVCEQFKSFLGKLLIDLDFDVSQARLYATGGKGFHVEIPAECFMGKVPATGTPWLPYIYREMAQSLIVDTLDLNVFTGKRGRQWRTTNVQRDNGCYKVPLTLDEAMSMTPELYSELVRAPRPEPVPTPPVVNGAFAMLFDRSKDKVTKAMAGKKKRQEKANAVLDPWKRARKTPPTIEKIMSGEDLREGTGFQAIAMQLAIYATSVDMALHEFLDRCKGLVANHVSDSRRYNTERKRNDELRRMYEYMGENSLYDFDVGPMVRLLKDGVQANDLGVVETEDREDVRNTGPVEHDVGDGDEPSEEVVVNLDAHKGLRRGFFMNADGMFKKDGENISPVCRATLRRVDAFYSLEDQNFIGYEFDMVVAGRKKGREMLSSDDLLTSANLKKFFTKRQLSFQGSDSDAASLLDIMAEKSERGEKVYVYHREGFFVIPHPTTDELVKVYLTRDHCITSLKDDDPDRFTLRYRPNQSASPYNIDIHRAPELGEEHIPVLEDLFNINQPTVVADMLGWFTAAHYRSLYLHLFNQFPLLQVYGEAGSGKSQTVMLFAHMHWLNSGLIGIKSALASTPFVMDVNATSSHSAPFIIDEYKPREIRMVKGKLEKLKDVLKASYIGANTGERGTVNKTSDHALSVNVYKATAPICFMGEAIEMETAIVERSVVVPFSKGFHTQARKDAFDRVQAHPEALSALGRALVEAGFRINLEGMSREVRAIEADITSRAPKLGEKGRTQIAPRLIYNRAVITHALRTLRVVLQSKFGNHFDGHIDMLLGEKKAAADSEERSLAPHAMSEISKVMSRIAMLSREPDAPYGMVPNKDYLLDEGTIEVRVERAYDQYRRYCASIRDTPLFDTLEAFLFALHNYPPVTSHSCPLSPIREDGDSDRIYRFSLADLKREGVGTFR